MKKRNYILHVLKSETLPHIGTAGVMHAGELESQEPSASGEEQKSSIPSSSRGRWSGRMRQYRGQQYTNAQIGEECLKKAMYIGFATRRLVHIFQPEMKNGVRNPNFLPQDDRDHFSNKRMDTRALCSRTTSGSTFADFCASYQTLWKRQVRLPVDHRHAKGQSRVSHVQHARTIQARKLEHATGRE